MTIQWLSSKRVEGDDADKDTIPVNSLENGYSFTALDTPAEYIWNGVDTWVPIAGEPVLPIGGWKELGRTTLGVSSAKISVSGLADKRYYMVLHALGSPSGGVEFGRRFNGTTTQIEYSMRYSGNGATDTVEVSRNRIRTQTGTAQTTPAFLVTYLSNLASEEKLLQEHLIVQDTAGAGTPPARAEGVGKWTNVVNPLTQYNLENQAGAPDETWPAGSEVVVLGWDPDDTHTDNFWEELASVTLSSPTDTVDTGIFGARKYLWIQTYLAGSNINTNERVRFNVDTGTNFTIRESDNGATDSTDINQTAIDVEVAQNTAPKFTNMFVINNVSSEKLVTGHTVEQGSVGEANTPQRKEFAAKWTNTTNSITRVQLKNNASALFDTGSLIKVWGHQ